MSPLAIVSYDDTANDHDALALGRLLALAGLEIELAYVRHTSRSERLREELENHQAEALLSRGARWLGDENTPRRVVLSASTGDGLTWLAEHESADVVVFGSDYRTASGHVQPGLAATRLLDGGPAAVALAPANLRARRVPAVNRIGVLSGGGDSAAQVTAWNLAEALGADPTATSAGVDLLVVGSRTEAPHGRVMISAQGAYAIETASCPVLVVARGVPLKLAAPVAALA